MSEKQLKDSLTDIKYRIVSITDITNERLVPLDLSIKCSAREDIKASNPIKYKVNKEKKEVECRVCE